MIKCEQCPEPAEAPEYELCASCAVELAYLVLGTGPDAIRRTCKACGQSFGLLEARVMRSVRNRKAGDPETPELCWVCTRLHYSARQEDPVLNTFTV